MHHWLIHPPLHVPGWSRDACGYLAATLVLSTFSVRSMRLLRWFGIASNVAFISYALLAAMPPILILHVLLLPVNVWRLIQLERLRGTTGRGPGGPAAPSAGTRRLDASAAHITFRTGYRPVRRMAGLVAWRAASAAIAGRIAEADDDDPSTWRGAAAALPCNGGLRHLAAHGANAAIAAEPVWAVRGQ